MHYLIMLILAVHHVSINGASLTGLLLAIALAKRNIWSIAFEIRSVPTTKGGAIAPAPHTLHVLDHTIGIYDLILKMGFEYEHIEFYSETG